MEIVNEILKEKIQYLDEILNKVQFKIKEITDENQDNILIFRRNNIKKSINILKVIKNNLCLREKIIQLNFELKNKEQEKVYVDKVDLKLEDLEGIKLFINQLEEKEKKINKFNEENKNYRNKIVELKLILFVKNKNLLKFECKKLNTITRLNSIKNLIHKNDSEIISLKEKVEKLDNDNFELEGVKRIQYETIRKLKDDIANQNTNINSLKENFKLLVDEFNLIMKRIK